ncbi:MAG: septum formation initiator family protein [Balneolaceae bacterium]
MNLQILNPLRWKKSFLTALLIAFVAVWFLFIDTYSVYTRYDLNKRKADLENKTEQLRREIGSIEQKLENLKDNPDLLEKIAREEYGMRKPGETVYRIRTE